MADYLLFLRSVTFFDVLDIIIVATLIYQIYRLVSRTPALPVLQGFAVVIFVTFLSRLLDLKTVNFILEQVLSLLLISIVVLFPTEIKRFFSRISYRGLFIYDISLIKKNIEILLFTIGFFRKRRIGALFIFTRKDRLTGIVKSGVEINAPINRQLLVSIFQKESPLHDGAVVIRKNKILASACYIPSISFNYDDSAKRLGTRHRSALSLSEISDAFIVIVSEETGAVSIAEGGNIISNVSQKRLGALLEKL